MSFLWALAWAPLVVFVAWRVKRRLRYLHRYGYHGRHHAFRRRSHWGHDFAGDYRHDGHGFSEDEQHGWGGHRFGGGFGAGMGQVFQRGFAWRRRGRSLFGLFRHIDASPGQEKAILKLVDDLLAKLGDARADFVASRRELAAALSGDEIDSAALDAVFLRNTELFVKLSRELQSALVSTHQTLDADQRKLLAEVVAHGLSGRPSYAPHPAYAL
jgi:uncharacterized membrane protein